MFTYDRVVLEEDVVAFTTADLEDEFADVEQVVPTDAQLERKMQKTSPNFCIKCSSALDAFAIVA